jgi:predicted nucleic acid-binding protein
MTLVVDASVAAKWVLEEEGSDRAVALRDVADDLIAPALIVAAISNALRNRAMRNAVSARDGVRALRGAISLFARLIPPTELTSRSTELAMGLRHPIYDRCYFAQSEDCALITADGRLIGAARRAKGI